MRIALAVGGIAVGVGLFGLAWNNHLTQAWDILSGRASISDTKSGPKPKPRPKPPILPPPFF